MISLSHASNGNDEAIFLVEFLVIMALTITRLHKVTFPNENIVPGMVFLFTSDNLCRILQAHMDMVFLCYAAFSPNGSTKDLRTPRRMVSPARRSRPGPSSASLKAE